MRNKKQAEIIKKLIKMRYNSLSECANALGINQGTLMTNISRSTRKFIMRLKSVGVPIPDDMINPSVEKIKVFVDEDGSTSFRINEPGIDYNDVELLVQTIKNLQAENLNLKAENYDLKKQLEKLKN